MNHCPVSEFGLCLCDDDLNLKNGENASFYPRSGCFRVGRLLYNAREVWMGTHFWDHFIRNPGISKIVFTHTQGKKFNAWLRLTAESGLSGFEVFIDPTIGGIFPVIYVWRIQRQIRRFLRRSLEQRILAVMMSSHPLLGCQSCLANVPLDVMQEHIISLKNCNQVKSTV